MTDDSAQTRPARSPIGGVVKLIVMIAVLLLALLAVLVVVGVIPRESLGELASRILLIACIFGLASVALAFLMRSGRH